MSSVCYHSGQSDDNNSRQWDSLLVKEHSGPVSWKRLLSGHVILMLTCVPFFPMILSEPGMVAGAR